MVIIEKSFPRGGTSTKESTKTTESKEDIVFGALQTKPKKTKTKNDKKQLQHQGDDEHIKSLSAELLNYDTIQDGMNIMGMVHSVDELYITVSLPGRMTARISALEISESYTKATQEFLQAAGQLDNYKPLKELYKVGDILYGRVQEVKQTTFGRKLISLTLKPSEVHAELSHTLVRKGFIYSGAVEEVQEHGYIIESGIKGLRTFLPLEKSQQGHAIGEHIYLKVEKVTHDKLASTCICKELQGQSLKTKNQIEANIDYLLPTTIVQFHINKKLKDGLQGTIMKEAFTGYINEHQLAEPLALPEDYEIKSTVNARILYVMPLTKLVYLTLNTQNVNEIKNEEALSGQLYQRGDVIENAKVHHLGTGGVILVLDNKCKGIISFKTIKANYKGNYDQDELLTKYAKKTQHKVRVLGYDSMDSMYICTDDAKIVNEKILDLQDLKAGEIVTAVIKTRLDKVGGYSVQVGRIKGIIEKLYLAPNSKTFEPQAKIRCRVVAINVERKIAYLTNRPEYLSKSCKVLTAFEDAKANAVFLGTIVKRFDSYLLVKFFNNLKGILHKDQLTDPLQNELESFYEGQTMEFRVIGRHNEQISLGFVEDALQLGEIYPVTVSHILDSGLEVALSYTSDEQAEGQTTQFSGLIPLRLLSDFVDLLHAKQRMYPLNSELNVVCMNRNIFSLRDADFFQSHLAKTWQTVQLGDILRAYIKSISANAEVIELMVPIRGYNKLVRVHHKMLLVGAYRLANISLVPEQVVYVKVLGKEEATKTITVTAKLTDIWNGDLNSTADYLNQYLTEVSTIKKAYKALAKPIAKYALGSKVTARFQGVHVDTGDWQFQVTDTKQPALVKSSIVGKSKPPEVGVEVECVIIWIDYSDELLYISNKTKDIEHIDVGTKIPKNLLNTSGINAKVLLKFENLFICSLKKGQNPLVYCPTRLHYNDFERSCSNSIKEGDFCRLAFIHETRPIALLESSWKLWKDVNRKRKAVQESLVQKLEQKRLKIENKKLLTKEQKCEKQKEENNKKKRKTKEDEIMKCKRIAAEIKLKKAENISDFMEHSSPEDHSMLFYEDKTHDYTLSEKINEHKNTTLKSNKNAVRNLSGVSDFWTTDLSQLHTSNNNNGATSSDDEESDGATKDAAGKRKKKLSAVEKFKLQRAEEERLRAIENQYADPTHVPETVDQFDRAVLADPNNSKNWINYMVFHLQATEIDKARAVARRAVKAISFRCADELLNIWVALLNLELRYGSEEAYQDTLKEALTFNEPLTLYLRVLEILEEANRQKELLDLIGVMVKKFKHQPEVWKAVANAYFNSGMTEKAQQMLHKALASLPEREHVNTIVVFANLNHKYNNNEMAQTLMEQVVTSYPKRVDVWAQYVDMLIKDNLIDSARTVLERAVIQKIPLKKMRTVFKKYLEFEERFGTTADVEKVKKLAAEYVKNCTTL